MYNLPIINNTTNKINSKQFSPIKQQTTKIKFMSKGGNVNYSSYAPIAKLDYYTINNNSVTNIKREFRYEYANTYTDVDVPNNTYLSMEIPHADEVSITYATDIQFSGNFDSVNVFSSNGYSFTVPNSQNVYIAGSYFNSIHFPEINNICNVDLTGCINGIAKNVTGNFSNYVFLNLHEAFTGTDIVDASDMIVTSQFIVRAFMDSSLKYTPKTITNAVFAQQAFENCPLAANATILQNTPFMDKTYCNTTLQGDIVVNGYCGGMYGDGTYYNYTFYNTKISSAQISNVASLDETFYNCTNLKVAKIIDIKTNYGEDCSTNQTFHNCTNLTDVHMSKIYGYETFYNCTNLTNVTADDNMLTIPANRMYSDYSIFSNITNLQSLPNITITNALMDPSYYSSCLFHNCNITNLTISDYDCNINIMKNCNIDNLYIQTPTNKNTEFMIDAYKINNATIEYFNGRMHCDANDINIENSSYFRLGGNIINNVAVNNCGDDPDNTLMGIDANISNFYITNMKSAMPQQSSTGCINNMYIENLYGGISGCINNVFINNIMTNKPSFWYSETKCISWNSIPDSNLENSFFGCPKLETISNFSNVTNTQMAFFGCSNLTSINAKDMSLDIYAFYDCKNLTKINVVNIPTSNCSAIDGFFGSDVEGNYMGWDPLDANYYANTNITLRITGTTVTSDIIPGFHSFVNCGGTITIYYKNGTDFANNVGNSYLANSQNVRLVLI